MALHRSVSLVTFATVGSWRNDYIFIWIRYCIIIICAPLPLPLHPVASYPCIDGSMALAVVFSR